MATPINEPPVAIDYTSRDYFSLREALIDRIKTRLPAWSGDNPADFGVALVEAFAYVGDVTNYYIDRIANESYLPTATQRQSILNIARTYGYFPSGFRAASLTLQFVNSGEASVTLPAGTQVSGQISSGDVVFELIFTTESPVTVPAQVGEVAGTATVTAFQYENIADRPENASTGPEDIAGELLAVSSGLPEQTYQLLENQVVQGSVEVYVQNGATFEQWQEVDHLIDFGPNDPVYSVISDANEFQFVLFGDGVSGTIPPRNSVIKTRYKFGGGASGNISTNLINEIRKVPGLTSSETALLAVSLEVNNTSVGVGGSSPEDNDSIRENAPLALTALNRAITLKDYAALAVQVPGVGKAKAVADVWTSVNLYVAPQRNGGSLDQFPGYSTDPNAGGVLLPEWTSIQSSVAQFLTDRTQIGVTVTILPPTYTPVAVDIFYTKELQFTEQAIETAIIQQLFDTYSYVNSSFGAIIHPEEIEATIRRVPGVTNARVVNLYREEDSAARSILIGNSNELFVFLFTNISVAPLSADATLTSLVPSVGTLSPSFNASFGSYSLAVPNGTTSLTLTATSTSSAAVIRAGSTTYASGAAIPVTVAVGTTDFEILVTAADGITFKEYVVTITRAS
jgi:hypothetical protein